MPTQRLMVAILGGLAAAALIGLTVIRQKAFAASEVRFVGSFDLKHAILSFTPDARVFLRKMLVDSERLYFLVIMDGAAVERRGFILSRRVDGSAISAVPVPEGTTDFAVVERGRIAIHTVDRRTGRAGLQQLEPVTGVASKVLALRAPLLAIWSVGGRVCGLGWDGRLYGFDEVRQPPEAAWTCHDCAEQLSPPSVEVHRISEEVVAVVLQEKGEIDLVSTVNGSARRVRVTAPEVDLARARYQTIEEHWGRRPGAAKDATLARGLVVFPSAVDERGMLYLAVNAHDYDQGRPLVVLNNNGQLVRTLRIPEWRVPLKDRFTMVTFAVYKGLLFAGDRAGRVAVFAMTQEGEE